MFDATCQRIREVAEQNQLPLPDALRPSAVPGTKTYHVNMSVFRSAVDSWAIQQVFPVMPIHRLNEEPAVHATLADLTCDSDGKIDKFINPAGGEPLSALPLHEVRVGETYYLALFLSGVYQEIMGSIHNMFGSLNTVVVRAGEAQPVTGFSGSMGLDSEAHFAGQYAGEGFVVESVVRGETIGDVLSRANHSSTDMICSVKAAVDAAMVSGTMTLEAGDRLVGAYIRRMRGYTYMV